MSERAARIIRDVRDRSGLTQRELARRLRISSSRISDYESAKVDPSMTTLDRIVAVGGFELEVVAPTGQDPVRRRAQLRALASRAIDRSMTIEGKQVVGARTVVAVDEDLLLRRIASHRR